MDALISWIWPVAAGGVSWWASNRCRGKNAQKAFRFAAIGFWLLLLPLLNLSWLGLPFVLFNFWIIKMIPAVLMFLAAGNSILKEMRSQQRGEYTEKAM